MLEVWILVLTDLDHILTHLAHFPKTIVLTSYSHMHTSIGIFALCDNGRFAYSKCKHNNSHHGLSVLTTPSEHQNLNLSFLLPTILSENVAVLVTPHNALSNDE